MTTLQIIGITLALTGVLLLVLKFKDHVKLFFTEITIITLGFLVLIIGLITGRQRNTRSEPHEEDTIHKPPESTFDLVEDTEPLTTSEIDDRVDAQDRLDLAPDADLDEFRKGAREDGIL